MLLKLKNKHMDLEIIRLELASIALEMGRKLSLGEESEKFSDGADFVFERISKLCDEQSDAPAPRKAIRIPFSVEDLQELLNGRTFDWTFDGVDVHLFQGDEED